jgi:hypothetical protein
MKTITKTFMYLQLTALCFSTAFADPNVKQKDFEGSILSFETQTFEGTTMFVDGSGTGQATHLGQFTYTYTFVVDLLTGIGVGSAEFTAANGDALSTTVIGLGLPTGEPGVFHVVEQETIVGGTGRFADATGSFVLDRIIGVSGVSIGTVAGSIVTQKAH